MKTQDIKSNKLTENVVHISEAVNSLTEAVSVLESMKNSDEEIPLNTSFPKEGVDFYELTKHFEIGLIKQALSLTHGHQTNAAKLLNLKLTTLNSIIKRYKISY